MQDIMIKQLYLVRTNLFYYNNIIVGVCNIS